MAASRVHLRQSTAVGSTNAHASKTAKRGAAAFVGVHAGANLGQPPSVGLMEGWASLRRIVSWNHSGDAWATDEPAI
jgi:hypothetical protein